MNNTFIKDFFKSIAAGMTIAIACLISANSGNTVFNNVLPAFIFAIGLMIVVKFDLNLYTGKIGYVKSLKDFASCGLYLIGNVVGVAIICLSLANNTHLVSSSRSFVVYYYDINSNIHITNVLQILIKGIGCGLLMYYAVDIYKKSKSLLGVFTCVPAFILAGFEHSIADVAYIIQEMRFNAWNAQYFVALILFWLIVVIGNAIGAQMHRIWSE